MLETYLSVNVYWQLSMFRLLPARPLSRAWGSLASSELPDWLRRPVLGLYVRLFGCQMEEATVEDLQSYCSLTQLFTRRLKPGIRIPSMHHELVCTTEKVRNIYMYTFILHVILKILLNLGDEGFMYVVSN